MGSRGWPTQPSRFVMAVVPLCNSSGKKQGRVLENDRHTALCPCLGLLVSFFQGLALRLRESFPHCLALG